jgi:predicted dehydrogenase
MRRHSAPRKNEEHMSEKTPPAQPPGRVTPFSDITLPYRPQDPDAYRPGIGLVGCGGITRHHLQAYLDANYHVVALCDIDVQRAIDRQQQFFPKATVYSEVEQLLADERVEVVDITTHPPERPPLVEAALRARKHVLSQKPFVTDLDVGTRLANLADEMNVTLAVNQNGRWAPHFSYIRECVAAAWIGEVVSLHCAGHWDHSWVKGGPFEDVRHLILYDYAIHWFDLLTAIMGDREPLRVYASVARSPTQQVRPPLLGQALVEYDGAQASLVFDACNNVGSWDTTFVLGTAGSVRSLGTNENDQQVIVSTEHGDWRPITEGRWFNDGFHGAMGELLRSLEEKRVPVHNARNNLRSLALCFAAIESADTHEPVVPGSVRKLPG